MTFEKRIFRTLALHQNLSVSNEFETRVVLVENIRILTLDLPAVCPEYGIEA